MVKIVGLTGGIGSGKSLVASVFRTLEIPVYEADQEARILTDSDPIIRKEIEAWLGSGYYQNGMLNRPMVSELVFNNPSALEKLNSIIHPRVRAHFNEWIKQQANETYVIHEAAILFESGFHAMMTKNILVICPEEIRLSRIMKRDGITRESAVARMQNQWTEEKKIPLADFIISNNGMELIVPQIIEIHNRLK
jgi:dephospho-CoA kinase